MRRMLPVLALLLVCTAAVSVAYYYGFYLPGNTALESSRRCSVDGLSFTRDYERSAESTAPNLDRHWAEADVHFNRKMNTCLVEIKWDEMRDDELDRSAVVVDVYNNRQIISTHDTSD